MAVKPRLRYLTLCGGVSAQSQIKGLRAGVDIAARAIDVPRISHVINSDMPDTTEAYSRRIGHTGRMTQLGTALSLGTLEDKPMFFTIEQILGSALEKREQAGFEAGKWI